MDEKTMVNDILSSAKSALSLYQMGIAETENLQLRQVLQQLRDDTESFQYELFKVAKAKGYYKPAAPADESEIQTVKSELENC